MTGDSEYDGKVDAEVTTAACLAEMRDIAASLETELPDDPVTIRVRFLMDLMECELIEIEEG